MKHSIGIPLSAALLTVAFASSALAADLTVTMHKATQDETGPVVGTVVIASSDAGATFKLDLHGLPPGPHGFIVHENRSCGPTMTNGVRIPGGAAGGVFDPGHTYKHEGPAGEGYLGDLPVLVVEPDGTAKQTLTAPRMKDIGVLKGHGLIIHSGNDSYSDSPSLMGGTGGRIACGAIE